MKLLIIILTIVPTLCYSQDLKQFNQERSNIDKNLMTGLGSWATLNLVGSGVGWAITQDTEMKSFHQMNVMWNTVNLALALPGYLKAKKNDSNLGLSESIMAQHKTEKIFLFNAGIDFAYITSGFLLHSMAQNNGPRKEQLKGFGSSLVLQGAFLMIFDFTAFIIHKNHAKKTLNKTISKYELSTSGIGIKVSF